MRRQKISWSRIMIYIFLIYTWKPCAPIFKNGRQNIFIRWSTFPFSTCVFIVCCVMNRRDGDIAIVHYRTRHMNHKKTIVWHVKYSMKRKLHVVVDRARGLFTFPLKGSTAIHHNKYKTQQEKHRKNKRRNLWWNYRRLLSAFTWIWNPWVLPQYLLPQ